MKYADRDMILEAVNVTTTSTPDMHQVVTFQVRVLDSPYGEMSSAVPRQYDDQQLQDMLNKLNERALDQAGLKAFGRTLADWLLPPKQEGAETGVREMLVNSLSHLDQDTGLRLRLRLDKHLAVIPWEYMYVDAVGGGDGMDGFLALNQRIAIIRHEVLASPQPSTATKGNVKIVAAFASAANLPPLDLAKEKDNLKQALNGQTSVVVDYLDNAKVSDVESALAGKGEADVFHFAGHGTFDEQMGETPGTVTGVGSLFFNDGPITAEALGVLLNNSSVRLAVLGACESGERDELNAWSGIAPALVKANVAAVVANQFPIQDRCAIEFSKQFYQAALVAGLSIEEAVTRGRIGTYLADQNGRDWGAAVLYLRAANGLLFGGVADDTLRQKAINAVALWDDVLKRSRENAARFQGTPGRTGAAFIPQIYIQRTDVENILTDFLDSSASALVVTGDSGIGKTNLLCAWQQRLQNAGYIAFYYDCSTFPKAEVEVEVSRDLSPGVPEDLAAILERIDNLAISEAKQCVLLFDAVGEFRDGDNGPDRLVKNLAAFAQHSPVHIRVVMGCRTSAWHRLDYNLTKSLSTVSFQPAPNKEDAVLALDLFTDSMVKDAYARYAQFFHLKTAYGELSDDLLNRLRFPMMLRILAEAYRGETVTYQHQVLGLYEQFYNDRTRGHPKDNDFAGTLATEMLNQQKSMLPVRDLMRNDKLKEDMDDAHQDSSYNHLLDNGIITIVAGNRLLGDMVKFTSDQLGGYILALEMPQADADQVAKLMQNVQQFSLAWYTAQALLVLGQDPKLFAALAQNIDVEIHELIVDSLVELYADESEQAKAIIMQLLQTQGNDTEVEEAQCIGLKAAYFVKPPAQDVFLWAAVQPSPSLRQLTRDILYLAWRVNPHFTYGLLDQLTDTISLKPPALQEPGYRIEFIFDLLVTIYMNNCEQDYVIDETSDIFHRSTSTQLHLDAVYTRVLSPPGPDFEGFFVKWVDNFFTQPLLKAILFDKLANGQHFFDLPQAEKDHLKHIAKFLDPQTDLTLLKDELGVLLKSDSMIFNYVAALAFSIHAYQNFATIKPFMQSLFEELDGRGRLWLLLSLCVLLQKTPREWTGLAEEFTRRIIEEHPTIFYRQEPGFLDVCDFVLLPLGLAYGKAGVSMPYIEKLLSDGMQQSDKTQVQRCIEALGPVGFYYPSLVLHTLNTAIPNIGSVGLNGALIKCLSIMRIASFDAVDNFLRQIGADETLQRQISAASDLDTVDRFIQLLGLHNNAVHFSLFYPRMRNVLSIGALNLLAESASPGDFTTGYTSRAIQFTEDSKFQLKDWTLPLDAVPSG